MTQKISHYSKTQLKKDIEESRYFIEILDISLESLYRIRDVYNNVRYMNDEASKWTAIKLELQQFKQHEQARKKSLEEILNE